jgi:hypothetical protein
MPELGAKHPTVAWRRFGPLGMSHKALPKWMVRVLITRTLVAGDSEMS